MSTGARHGSAPNAGGACLRYGVIGAGMMGQGHLEVLEDVSGVEVAALTEPFPDNRAKALDLLGRQVPAYDDYHEMLEKESLDAVVVATPNHTHADIVCDALDAGLHVLGEKPMASTLDGCRRILEASGRSRGTYQIGLEMRSTLMMQRIHEIIDAGQLGEVRQLWCKEFRGPWVDKVDQWIIQKDKSGGALVDNNCHHFDLFNWFAGARPAKVSGFGSCDLVYGAERFGVTPDVLDNAQVTVRYEGGSVATLMLCMYCDSYGEDLELGVIGTEGWLVGTCGERDVLRMAPRTGGKETTVEFAPPDEGKGATHGGMVYWEHLAFAENIRHGRRPLTDAVAGWWATIVALAAEQAVAEERVVALTEFGPFPDEPGTLQEME